MEGRYKHVMLIDDNELDILVNSKVVETNKFAGKISSSTSPIDALKILQSAGADELPDIIFLDIMMPHMDGFGFLDEFAKLPATITGKCKVIMLSTSESFKDLNRANKNRHVYKFLNKPLTDIVLAAINV